MDVLDIFICGKYFFENFGVGYLDMDIGYWKCIRSWICMNFLLKKKQNRFLGNPKNNFFKKKFSGGLNEGHYRMHIRAPYCGSH